VASITDIDGIAPRHAERLRHMGIRTSDDLLAYGAGRKGRRELSKVTRLGEKRIHEWVKRADLLRIPGISVRYSDLLEAVGVESVRDLRRRSATKLRGQMDELNEHRQLVKRLPSQTELEDWIETARSLPVVMKRW
jgi:nucleotidyltransferase/DNA polymerase involved in DNA repair